MTVSTNPLTYNAYVSQICTMAVVQYSTVAGIVTPTDAAVQSIIPQMLNYAELRIQRDLDLLQGQYVNSGNYSLTAGVNTLAISVDDFIVPQTFAIQNGTALTPLLPSSKEYIQSCYNDSSYAAPPAYFAPIGGDAATDGSTSQLFIFGPYPDQSYPLTIAGLARMTSLYSFGGSAGQASTNTTFISTYLPDLLIMASMIYVSAYQRNFGRESDDPQMAQSYEAQYQALLKGAVGEEFRRKFQASAWTSLSPSPVASPTRG